MPLLTPEQHERARQRARQIFSFLKAFAERRQPLKRQLSDHDWSLQLRALPEHAAITLGEVLLNGPAGESTQSEGNGALLTIRRPTLTEPPRPPAALEGWLKDGWKQPTGVIAAIPSRNYQTARGVETEVFDADAERVQAFSEWKRRWESWAEAERPARAAMQEFERLYQLHIRLRLESERKELMLGDGHLRWIRGAERIDHPVLLQKVDLQFDPRVPEIRIVDAENPPELFTALLHGTQGLLPEQLAQLRQEVELRGFHPLERAATSAFLRQLAQQLGARGRFSEDRTSERLTEEPRIERDPVLLLRERISGFPAAFDAVIEELARNDVDIPVALIRLTGVEPPNEADEPQERHSPWAEPPDILLSKEANDEQIAIARAIERHRAVLVQGPPGTGKSHTIANLIGHLVAQGKSVLVTSHTTKALGVLRGHIIEPLRALAVAVLDNDLEGRTQLEDSVRTILGRLNESQDRLSADIERLAADRQRLIWEINKVTHDLRAVREAEYQPIAISSTAYPPAESARWVAKNEEGNAWIPAPLQPGAPLPLSTDEIAELYATNARVSPRDEAELLAEIPAIETLPSPEDFRTLIAHAMAPDDPANAGYWAAPPSEKEIPTLEALDRLLTKACAEIDALSPWEHEVVRAGHAGGNDVAIWEEFVLLLRSAHALWDRVKPLLVRHDPRPPKGAVIHQLENVFGQIVEHLASGGKLGWFTLIARSEWKSVIRASRVSDQPPLTLEHFQSLKAWVELEKSRLHLAARWERQAVPIGLPHTRQIGLPPEPRLVGYAEIIERRLRTWRSLWEPLKISLEDAAVDWRRVAQDLLARDGPVAPLERDLELIRKALPALVKQRLARCRAVRAERELREAAAVLASFSGSASMTLCAAIGRRDPAVYETAFERMRHLQARQPDFARRQALLAQLESSAPAWAGAIRRREPPHDAATAPGSVDTAWRWRQLRQELDRRDALDERELQQRLEMLRNDLRQTTAALIEKKAWLAQIRRVDLPKRQALQGWADTVRRIGRGTGRHAPALKATARKLLESARDAVPVWILPLAGVAESFSGSRRRFDVVIVDEASQSDPMGLLAWWLGERVVVVGDNEQVSPLDVGQEVEAAQALIDQHLQGVPNQHLYDGKTSIYDLAGQCFGGVIRLREHFRCMPAIIEFSNQLVYNGEIRSLRNPSSAPPPHLVEFAVPQALRPTRDGKTNLAEARLTVALLQAMVRHPAYEGKTFGAISLLGDEQAALIQDLALEKLGAVTLEARRFAAGNAAQFQGDERHVMLLSMVDVGGGGALPMRQTAVFKQRYNVAASRARDQLWLIHSLNLDQDLQQGDLRRRLIEHMRDPEARLRHLREAESRAESPFERAVIERLVYAGYRVRPQVWVGHYRIDIVVGGNSHEAAVECDGDRFHGVERIPEDMARQAILERAGWHFIRIRGTRFYRDPEGTMAQVMDGLARLGVAPDSAAQGTDQQAPGNGLRQEIERSAWNILRDHGWCDDALSQD